MNTYLVQCNQDVNGEFVGLRKMVIVTRTEDNARDIAEKFFKKMKTDSNDIWNFYSYKVFELSSGDFFLDNGEFFSIIPTWKEKEYFFHYPDNNVDKPELL